MPTPYRVALLGFSPFERNTLGSYFRLATHRVPSYTLVQTLTEPDFLVADADHDPSVQLALAEEMLARTVFVGMQAPPGATAWMQRPIDPLHVIRELDAMVSLLPGLNKPPATVPTPPADGTDQAAPAPSVPPETPETPAQASPKGLDSDDLPTLILPKPTAAPVTAPATPTEPVHGQRTVALPSRARRATIEAAFEGDGSSLPKPAQPQPAPAALHDEPPPAQPAAGHESRAAPPPMPEQAPPPRALLVDDSELARHFLARLLQPWGVVCDQAAASQHALQHLAGCDYDFIFLDLELGPGSDLDGLALCQHIKRLHNDVQAALATVVMVSAHHSASDRVRGSLAGCDAYLGKPLNQDELQELLLRQGLKPPAGALGKTKAPRPTRPAAPARSH